MNAMRGLNQEQTRRKRGHYAGAFALGAAWRKHANEHRSRRQMNRLRAKETVRSDEIGYLEQPRGGPPWLAEDHLANVRWNRHFSKGTPFNIPALL